MGGLHDASYAGDVSKLRLALQTGEEVDSKDNRGWTALLCASAMGNDSAMRVLLTARAAVNSHANTGVTALMCAGAMGHDNALRMLLEAGAAVDLKCNNDATALLLASTNGHEGAVQALLAAKAAVDFKSNSGRTALSCASRHGHWGTILVLLEAGAEVDATDESGASALVGAVRSGKLQVARVLLEAGAELPQASEMSLCSNDQMHRLLALHRNERRMLAAFQGRTGGAATAAVALLAEEGQRVAAEGGLEEISSVDAAGVTAGAGPRASQACDGADELVGAKVEKRNAAVAAPLESQPVVSVSAEEVLRALEAAGSNGEVGEGGFGKVCAAELPSLAARWGRVAVKRASGLQAADILQEVATLRLCSHRNVLPLLGYCDDARAACMITPLMHGGSLDDRLLLSGGTLERLRRLNFEGDVRLDWQRRLSALCDAARGLAHLHGQRILHRDVKTANILLEGALRPLPMSHGPPLLVYRAVLSDVGLAKVREPTLGFGTTHATTRTLAFSMGFVDLAVVNSNQHSERTDAFGIGICILMSLVSEPAAGLMNDHEDDVCDAMGGGTSALYGRAHAVAGWPSDATRALAALVHGLSLATKRNRQPLAEALGQMEALLGAVGEEAMAQPAPAVVGASSAVGLRSLLSSRGVSIPPVREDEPDARAAASSQPEGSSGGELTRMVRQLELGDADAPLARMRERVTKAFDSMMVRLERAYAGQGHAPLSTDEQELRKIDLLAPHHLGRLNGLAHTLRKWWNEAKHQRDQWAYPPSDKEVQRLVREVIAELDGLGW